VCEVDDSLYHLDIECDQIIDHVFGVEVDASHWSYIVIAAMRQRHHNHSIRPECNALNEVVRRNSMTLQGKVLIVQQVRR
jgi:hypothetical protein